LIGATDRAEHVVEQHHTVIERLRTNFM